MQRFIGLGRLTKDPETRTTESGKDITIFSIAFKRDYKNANGEYDADFINCKAFGNTGKLIQEHFTKGNQIAIEGKIHTGKYEKDGKTSYITEVLVDRIDFIGSKEKPQNEAKNEQKNELDNAFEEFANEIELSDSDLPF